MSLQLVTINKSLDRDECIKLANDMLTDIYTLAKYYADSTEYKTLKQDNIADDNLVMIGNKIATIRNLLDSLERVLK